MDGSFRSRGQRASFARRQCDGPSSRDFSHAASQGHPPRWPSPTGVPHHGAVPLKAQPSPSTCTRPGRSNHLRRRYTFLTPPGHLDVPKHSPPLTTRKAGSCKTHVHSKQSATMASTLHQNHPITFSYIKHERSVQISPVFEPNRRHNEPQGQKMWPFSCERASKKTRERSYTASIDTRRATRPTKRTERIRGPISIFVLVVSKGWKPSW